MVSFPIVIACVGFYPPCSADGSFGGPPQPPTGPYEPVPLRNARAIAAYFRLQSPGGAPDDVHGLDVRRRLPHGERADFLLQPSEPGAIAPREPGPGEQPSSLFQQLGLRERASGFQAEQVAGEDLVDSPATDGLDVIVDDDMVAVAPQDRHVRVRRGLYDQRAVRRDDELGVDEALGQEGHQALLPPGVQVEVDLVHEDDCRLGERVLAVRVALDEAAGQVHHPGDECPVAEAEAGERNPPVGCLHLDPWSADRTPNQRSRRGARRSKHAQRRSTPQPLVMLASFRAAGTCIAASNSATPR